MTCDLCGSTGWTRDGHPCPKCLKADLEAMKKKPAPPPPEGYGFFQPSDPWASVVSGFIPDPVGSGWTGDPQNPDASEFVVGKDGILVPGKAPTPTSGSSLPPLSAGLKPEFLEAWNELTNPAVDSEAYARALRWEQDRARVLDVNRRTPAPTLRRWAREN